MRRKCYWDKHGEQVAEIIDDPEDRHKSRNVASFVVGKNKVHEEKLAKRRKKK